MALLLDSRRMLDMDAGGGDVPGSLLLLVSGPADFLGEVEAGCFVGNVTLVLESASPAGSLFFTAAPFALGEIWNMPFGGKILCAAGRLDAAAGGDDWLIVEYARDLFGDCWGGDNVGCGDEKGFEPSRL